jgi:hypothetical protein
MERGGVIPAVQCRCVRMGVAMETVVMCEGGKGVGTEEKGGDQERQGGVGIKNE